MMGTAYVGNKLVSEGELTAQIVKRHRVKTKKRVCHLGSNKLCLISLFLPQNVNQNRRFFMSIPAGLRH